jgi:hypothetical protein
LGPCFCSRRCSSCSRGGEEIGRPHLFGTCSCCVCVVVGFFSVFFFPFGSRVLK